MILRLLLYILIILVLLAYKCNSYTDPCNVVAEVGAPGASGRKLRDANGRILQCTTAPTPGGGGGVIPEEPAPTPEPTITRPGTEPTIGIIQAPAEPSPPTLPAPAPTPPLCSPGYDYFNNCAQCGKFYYSTIY